MHILHAWVDSAFVAQVAWAVVARNLVSVEVNHDHLSTLEKGDVLIHVDGTALLRKELVERDAHGSGVGEIVLVLDVHRHLIASPCPKDELW